MVLDVDLIAGVDVMAGLEVCVVTNSHKVRVAMLPYFEAIGKSCYQVPRSVPSDAWQSEAGSRTVHMYAFDVLVLALRHNHHQEIQNKESWKYFDIEYPKTDSGGNILKSNKITIGRHLEEKLQCLLLGDKKHRDTLQTVC